MALKPTITIGTGYEEQQRKAASRRKIAEALLAQGLQSNPNMSSWAQVLGQMAQAWAGKSMQRQADTMDADVAGKVREDYNTRRQAFLADINNLAPQQVVAKYGNDPYLEDEVKPYREALATALKEREGLGSFGGRMVRRGDVLNQYANDPNDTVFADPNGNLSLNPVKIAGAVASQGLPMVDERGRQMYQTTGRLPQGLAAMPQTTAVPESKTVSFGEAQRMLASLPPDRRSMIAMMAKQNGFAIAVSSPQEADSLPSGTPIVMPDGTTGVVP